MKVSLKELSDGALINFLRRVLVRILFLVLNQSIEPCNEFGDVGAHFLMRRITLY